MEKNIELELPFGSFNAPSKNNFKKFLLDNNFYSKESFVNELIKEKLTHNIYENKVFFKAIVLRTEEYNSNNILDVLNLTSLLNFTKPIRFYARIPELHSHIPTPEDLNNIPEEILLMHPLFEGPSSLGQPKVGSIVTVSFENVEMQSNGKYIENSENTSEVGNNSTGNSSNANTSNNSSNDPESIKARGKMQSVRWPNSKQNSEGMQYFERGGIPIDLIVIHETNGASVSRERTIASLVKDGLGVHYIITRDGIVSKHIEETFQTIHGAGPKMVSNAQGTGINARSIGIEIVNRVDGSWKKDSDEIVVNVPWKTSSGSPGQILPTLKQCESCWNLIKEICQRNNLPIYFYAQDGVNLHYGRKNAYPKGITCHKRYDNNRSDGPFVENYCYLRSKGHNPRMAAKILFEDIYLSLRDKKKSHLLLEIQNLAIVNPETNLFKQFMSS